MSDCNAMQFSDQMACSCGNAWDMNDPYPPECKTEPAVLAAVPAVRGEPVAYAVFADNGNIRIWCADPIQAKTLMREYGDQARPLYAAPQPAEQQPNAAQLVEALEKARDAIGSLPQDALGNVPDTQQSQGWHIRDELINEISTALAAYRKGEKM